MHHVISMDCALHMHQTLCMYCSKCVHCALCVHCVLSIHYCFIQFQQHFQVSDNIFISHVGKQAIREAKQLA